MIWNRDSLLLTGLVLVFAIWAWVHLTLCARVMRMAGVPKGLRVVAFVPPIAAILGYRGGLRGRAVLWWVLGVVYLVLRTAA